MISIFGITIVLYFTKIFSGSRNYWSNLRSNYSKQQLCGSYKNKRDNCTTIGFAPMNI